MGTRTNLQLARAVARAPDVDHVCTLNPWGPAFTCKVPKKSDRRIIIELLNAGHGVDWDVVQKYCSRQNFVLAVR